jgi:hypothetical protein
MENTNTIELLKKYVDLYNLIYSQIEQLMESQWNNEEFQNQTFLPKEFQNKK